MVKPRLIRITTVPISLKTLLKGQHRFMRENDFEILGVSSSGKELEDVRNEEGIRVVELEMTRTISPLNDIKSLWNFYKLCKKEKPNIVHSHTPKAGIVGMLGARLAGVSIRLHTVAGLPLMETRGLKRKVLNFVEKLTYSCATNVYPNSKGLYDFILENGLTSEKKLKVIANGSSNGIDTSHFSLEKVSMEHRLQLKNELNIGVDDFVFVFVGRLVGDKGINELISSFSELEILNLKLLLVGSLESELDPLLPETLKEIESNSNIISVGFQKDVRPYFAISNTLVFPSYREGFPNVVMQAGAMGLPSIVTDINGCNEIIENRKNGIIIPVKNTKALVKGMQQMIRNSDNYYKMRDNARVMITSRFEQIVVWNGILNEYQNLLKLGNVQKVL